MARKRKRREPRKAKTFTAVSVLNLKGKPGVRDEWSDGGCPGLRLQITRTGAKGWLFRYRRPNGDPARLTVGSCDTSSLPRDGSKPAAPALGGHLRLGDARALATEARNQVARGLDPGVARQVEKKRRKVVAQTAHERSYESLVRVYVRRYAMHNRRDWKDMARQLGLDPSDEALPVIPGGTADRWKGRAAAEIEKVDVTLEINRAIDEGERTSGNHKLEALRAFWRWSMKNGPLTFSPCAMLDMPVKPKTLKRTRRLTDTEMAVLWRALDRMPPIYAAMVRGLILSGVRRDELREAVESEINGDELVVPPSRTKNKLDFLILLTPAVKAQLDAARAARKAGKAGLIFTLTGRSPAGGLSKWKRQLDAHMAEINGAPVPQWQLHDLRRNFRTYLSRVTSNDVAERALGHVKDQLRQHYDLYQFKDERIAAQGLWAREVERIVTGEPGKVITMRKRGRS